LVFPEEAAVAEFPEHVQEKTPEMLSMMRLSKRPSTVVRVPETNDPTNPARG